MKPPSDDKYRYDHVLSGWPGLGELQILFWSTSLAVTFFYCTFTTLRYYWRKEQARICHDYTGRRVHDGYVAQRLPNLLSSTGRTFRGHRQTRDFERSVAFFSTAETERSYCFDVDKFLSEYISTSMFIVHGRTIPICVPALIVLPLLSFLTSHFLTSRASVVHTRCRVVPISFFLSILLVSPSHFASKARLSTTSDWLFLTPYHIICSEFPSLDEGSLTLTSPLPIKSRLIFPFIISE